MYALLINPERQLPTAKNMNSRDFEELTSKGYHVAMTGNKRRILDKAQELMEELNLSDLDIRQD